MFGLFKYPYIVIIFNKRANNFYITTDRAKLHKNKKGEQWFRLKKRKLNIKPTHPNYKFVSKKKDFIFLYSTSPTDYKTIGLDDAEEKLKVLDEDTRFWFSEQLRKNYDNFQKHSTLEKYLPVMMFSIAVLILGITMYIVWDGMGSMASNFDSMANSLTDVSKNLIDAMALYKGQPVVNSISAVA